MKSQISRQISLATQIVDGSVRINSVKEFQAILKIFPKDASLHRCYSDLLMRRKSFTAAAQSYGKAARLFIESGMILQAIVCKLFEWRLNKPSHQTARHFYETLHARNYHETPVNLFLIQLSYPELVAMMNRIEHARFTDGKTVRKIGDVENDLYFVVFGKLKTTTYEPLKKEETEHRTSTHHLSENDVFGDIYPFEKEKLSHSHTEALGRVELVKISRSRLIQVCKKYPNIELGIIDLLRARSVDGSEGVIRTVRRTDRHKLPVKMNLKIWPYAAENHTVVIDGYSSDVSVGGMGIVLDSRYMDVPAVYQNLKNAKIQVSLPHEALTISVLGNIVWSRESFRDGEKILAMGIQFQEMSPKLVGMLVAFADSFQDVA